MPVVPCPHCRAEVEPDGRDRCPACGAELPPPARRVRGFRRVRVRPPTEDDAAEDLVNHAKGQCEIAALGLLYLGLFHAAAGPAMVGCGLLPLLGVTGPIPPEYLIVSGAYLFVSGVVTFYAGVRMRRAEAYPLCVAGCVLMVAAVSPWWFLGIPLGLFGLYKLTRPRVRLGFAANRQQADPDAG